MTMRGDKLFFKTAAAGPGELLNKVCDALATPRLHFLDIDLPAYGVFVCLGGAAGLVMTFVIAISIRLPPAPLFIAAVGGIFVALTFAYLTKVVTGTEVYTFYHYQIAVLAGAGMLLWLVGEPPLRNIDVLTLSLGLTQAIGRIGCFGAGCCYGRPRRFGVCYNRRHASIGFPSSLVGVRLFPIQLVESCWIAIVVSSGILSIVRGAAPGSALAWYVVLYGSGRFIFEFLRLDTGFVPGKLSEAQITSLTLILAVVCAELRGLLVMESVHLICVALLIASACAIRMLRKREIPFSASHVFEIAEAVQRAERDMTSSPELERIAVEQTSRGVLISAGRIPRGANSLSQPRDTRHQIPVTHLYPVTPTLSPIASPGSYSSISHYCVSGAEVGERSALAVARLIGRLRCGSGSIRLFKDDRAFHVIIN